MRSPQFRHIRQTLYALKRQYGIPVDLYYIVAQTVDTQTGLQTQAQRRISIARGIVLPDKSSRNFSYDAAYTSAIRPFTYGALYDHSLRNLILDRRDVPDDFIVDLNCSVDFDNKRYEVKSVHEYEHNEALLLVIDELKGKPGRRTINVVASSVIQVQSSAVRR